MNRMLIVGNGFDLEHGLKTAYWNFREYLEENHLDFLIAFEKMYNFYPVDFGDPYVGKDAQQKWEKNLKSKLWESFEEAIGSPDIGSMLNTSECILDNLDLDGGNVGIEDTMDEYWRNEYGFIKQFPEYVKEWIEQISTKDIVPRKQALVNDIQPVHYLNENSTLRKDISDTFQRILKEGDKEETETQIMLKDYLLHELMFYKPYQGNFVNRNTNEKSKKCFCDECEWRYVPNVRGIGLKQAIPEHEIPNTGLLTTYSNSMDGIAEVSLCFEYNEIKHIIIPTLDEYRQLVENIDLWKLGDEKYDILSKIIVWEQSRGDF